MVAALLWQVNAGKKGGETLIVSVEADERKGKVQMTEGEAKRRNGKSSMAVMVRACKSTGR